MKYCFWGSIYDGLLGKPLGGGELQLSLLVKYLNLIGEEVIVIDFDTEQDIELDGVKIISLKKRKKRRNPFSLYKVFYTLLKETNADIYYARMRSSIHLIGLFAAKKNKAKFVYHVASDLDTLSFKERWEGYYKNTASIKKLLSHFIHSEVSFPIILNQSTHIITQHSDQTANLKKKGVVNTFESKNIFDFSNKNNIGKSSTITSIKAKDYYITIGSLDRRKGVETLKTIISEMKNNFFVVIGKARDKHGKQFVEEIKSYNNVQYIEPLEHSQVLQYIKDSKGLISTSLIEGFSNVFIEAWSMGVPVYSLNVNPSGIITKYNLGKCYQGDITKMIFDLKQNTDVFEKENIINYVETFHNPQKNILKINDYLKLRI